MEQNKKTILIILISVLLLLVLVFVGWQIYQGYFVSVSEEGEPGEDALKIQEQIKELDDLRAQSGSQPLTDEEREKQIQELDMLHEGAMNSTPKSVAEQLEELESLMGQ